MQLRLGAATPYSRRHGMNPACFPGAPHFSERGSDPGTPIDGTPSGNDLTKTAPETLWNAGAVSVETLAGNGYVEGSYAGAIGVQGIEPACVASEP